MSLDLPLSTDVFELPRIATHSPSLFLAFSIATSTAALLLNYVILGACPCAASSQYKHIEGGKRRKKRALLKPRLSAIGVIFYAHNDDINTCVQNQRDYTLGLFEWVEEGFRVRTCEWRKVKEGLYSFHVAVAVVFPVIQGEHFRAAMHAYAFVGWSESDIRHSDSEGEGLSFRELIGNARVSPLKPCMYALLMKCDGE